MRAVRPFTILLVLTVLFLSCGKGGKAKLHLIENIGYAQGTTYHIKYLSPSAKNLGKEIEELLEAIDYSMSTYRVNSIISEINEGGGWVEVDSLFMAVLTRSIEIAEETNGDFDPTVGPLTKLWGFTYEELDKDIGEQQIVEALQFTGIENVEVKGNQVRLPKGFELDFNAIAPGFTSDAIADLLEDYGITNYMVEMGGEIRAKGKNERNSIWKIGVDKPHEIEDNKNRFEFILELKDAGLATSGNYRKFWVDEGTGIKYAHTINPHTGYPAKNRMLSATIITPKAIDADAYATVCMVKGFEACKDFLNSKPDLEAYLIYTSDTNAENDWQIYMTEGFKSFLIEEFKL